MTQNIKAALIDAEGLFLRLDELESVAQLTALHLPQITQCDLEPRKYRWIAEPNDMTNPLGGRFEPLPRATPARKFDQAEPLPALACFLLNAWARDPSALPAPTLDWLDEYVASHDFKAYLTARGLAYLDARKQQKPKGDK